MEYLDIMITLLNTTTSKLSLSFTQVATLYTMIVGTFILTLFFSLPEGIKQSLFKATTYTFYIIAITAIYFVMTYAIDFSKSSVEKSIEKVDKKLDSAKSIDK